MKTFVISGATGMLGSAIVRELLDRGDRVLALVRPDSARSTCLPEHPNLICIPCGMADYASYEPRERADVFLHLAWGKTTGGGREDVDAQLSNVAASLEAVRLAHRFGCESFVGAGSQAEYGPVTEPLCETTPADPQSGYGIAKYAAGKLTRTLCAQLGIRHCWARILSIFGENDASGTLISYLIRTLSEGGVPELTPCEQIWDYLYVADAARALIAIGERGHDGRVYPVGSGEGRPLADFVRELRDCVAPDGEVRFGAKPYYPHQPMLLVADITQLQADTGFVPRVSFRAGIERILLQQSKEK